MSSKPIAKRIREIATQVQVDALFAIASEIEAKAEEMRNAENRHHALLTRLDYIAGCVSGAAASNRPILEWADFLAAPRKEPQ